MVTLLWKVTFPTVSLQNALVVPRAAFVTYKKVEINFKISQQWPFTLPVVLFWEAEILHFLFVK